MERRLKFTPERADVALTVAVGLAFPGSLWLVMVAIGLFYR